MSRARRPVPRRDQRADHSRTPEPGNPSIVIVADTGYDITRLVYVRADLPVDVPSATGQRAWFSEWRLAHRADRWIVGGALWGIPTHDGGLLEPACSPG